MYNLRKRKLDVSYVTSNKRRVITFNKNWISPSSLYNYMHNDPFIDWLKYNNTSISRENTRPNIMGKFLCEQGIVFEHNVMAKLYSKFKGCIENIDCKKLCTTYADITKDCIKRGVPIIYQGFLYDEVRKYYGVPDLIVREDYINLLTGVNHISKYNTSRGNYTYRIVDIKFATLHLAVDGVKLLKKNSTDYYKAQLYIYNHCLGKIQGYTPSHAYIIANRVRTKDAVYDGMNKLVQVELNKEVQQKVQRGIKWVRTVHKLCNIGDDIKLYPNMKIKDTGYNKEKLKIANDIGEITSVYYCGVKNREYAIRNHGITSWRDKRLNSTTLNIKGKTSKLVDAILNTNRSDTIINKYRLQNNQYNWKHNKNLVFIDFEYINSAFTYGDDECHDSVFMIGAMNSKGEYTNFTVRELTEREECNMFTMFVHHLDTVYGLGNAVLVCWSNAEISMWRKLQCKYNLPTVKFIDFCKVLQSEHVAINGSLNYQLKNVARALYSHGMIDVKWDDDVCDGITAMIIARECDVEMRLTGKSIDSMPRMIMVKEYNRIDCDAVRQILMLFK